MQRSRSTGDISGNLAVADGSSVNLSNASVGGDVLIIGGGSLSTSPSGAGGTVLLWRRDWRCAASLDFSDDLGTTVGGDVVVKFSGSTLLITFANIGGDLVLGFNETVDTILMTTIDGALVCYGNTEEPPFWIECSSLKTYCCP